MKQLLFYLFLITSFAAAAQPRIEPLGKKTGRVQAQNEFEVLGDLFIASKDTTGSAPSKLGAMRRRPQDGFFYIYAKTTGKKWYPLIPKSTFDTTTFVNGLYYLNGTIGVKIASTADTGVVTNGAYAALIADSARRLDDVTIDSSGISRTLTFHFHDGTQIVRSFGVSATGGLGSIGVGDIGDLYTAQVVNSGGTATISFTPKVQNPLQVLRTTTNTEAPTFGDLSTDYIKSGVFSPERLPLTSGTSDGMLSASDYNRLFTRQAFANPTGTLAMDINAGGQIGVTFTTTGGRVLSLPNLRIGDKIKIAFTNNSGSAITLTLPSLSYVQGTGAAASVSIPNGRSVLQLEDFDGIYFWFSLRTF